MCDLFVLTLQRLAALRVQTVPVRCSTKCQHRVLHMSQKGSSAAPLAWSRQTQIASTISHSLNDINDLLATPGQSSCDRGFSRIQARNAVPVRSSDR